MATYPLDRSLAPGAGAQWVSTAAVPRHPLQSLLELCVVLFPTLNSYYFYQINLAPLPVASFILVFALLFLAPHRRVDGRTFLFAIAATAVMFLSYMLALGQSTYDLYPNSLLGVAIGPAYFAMFCAYFSRRPESLDRALRLVILIHLVPLALQVLVYYTSGRYLDFLSPITGQTQRYLGWTSKTGTIRATGLHSEPATYSLCIVSLVYVRRRFSRALSSLDFAALGSAVITFSFLGLALSVLLVSFQILLSPKYLARKLAGSVIAVYLLATTIGPRILEYAMSRSGGLATDASFVARYQASLNSFQTSSPARQMFGIGIGNTELGALLGSYGSTYSYLLVHLGVLFSAALLGLICWHLIAVHHVGARALLFLFVLLMGTYQITFVTFWFVLACLATLERADYLARKQAASLRPGVCPMRSPLLVYR